MAKKKRVNWEDMFSGSNPSWAQREREEFLNNDKKFNAMIDAVQNDAGVEFDGATRMSMLQELRSGKELNFSQPAEEEEVSAPVLPSTKKPDFRNVEAVSGSTEEGTVGDTASTMGATLRDAFKGMGARLIEQSERLPGVGSTYSLIDMLTGVNPAEVPREAAAELRASANDPLRQARTAALSERFEAEGGVKGFMGAGAVDALQSPSSVLSLVGGPVGAVAVADAYASAYEQGQNEGLKGEQLEAWALSQSAPELLSMIPAGQVVGKLPIIGPLIKDRIAKLAAKGLERKIANPVLAGAVRTAQTMVGEPLEEMATGSLQDLASAAFAGQTQAEDLRRMGQKAMPQDEEGNFSLSEFAGRRGREGRAAVVTGGMAAPVNQVSAYRDSKREQAAQNERTVADVLAADKAMADKARAEDAIIKTETDRVWAEEKALRDAQAAFIGAPRQEGSTDLPRSTGVEPFEDFANREAGLLEAEAERTADVQETFNRMPRVETEPGAERPATAGVEPFEAFAEREAAAIQARDERAAVEAEAATRLETAQKRITLEEKRKVAAAKAAETVRRDNLAKQVAKDHADKTPKEQAAILADLMETPDAKAQTAKDAPKSPEDRVQSVINQVEGMRKRQNSQRTNNRIRSLYRQDPTRTAQDIANILAEQEGTAPTQQEVDAPTEQELQDRIAKLNKPGELDMAGTVDAADVREQEVAQQIGGRVRPRTAAERDAYVKKVTEYVSALPNNNEGVAIRNLIKQGKVVITDTTESVGLNKSTAAGSYFTDSGKVVVRLNNLDPKMPKASILAAVVAHEAGHVGQFNQRDGRSKLFQHLLGDKGNAAANQQIRVAAANGNKIAKAAMDKAIAAAKVNKTAGDLNVADIELVPYLFTEVKFGPQALGTVAKVVRDVKAAARQANRKLLNKDLDFSIDEILAASDKVAQEIVETNVKGSDQTAQADMVGGRYATGFNEAEAEGRVFTPAIDNQERFEFDDSEAELAATDADVYKKLMSGASVPLTDLLVHPELARQYPELSKDIIVKLDPKMDSSNAGTYQNRVIKLSPLTLLASRSDPEELRNTLLHEAQHAVQEFEGFVAGANKSSFVPKLVKDMVEYDATRLNGMIKSFELPVAVNALPPEAKARWESMSPEGLTRSQQVLMFVQAGMHNSTTDRVAQRLGTRINDSQASLRASRADLVNAERKAFQTYMRDRGEAEARTVEQRSRLTPDQRQAAPFEEQVGGDIGLAPDALIDTSKLPPVFNADLPAESKGANPQFSIKERINRILSHGRQDRLDTVKIAEDLHSQLVDALKADTGRIELSDSMNREMNDFLTSPDHATVEGRARIIAQMSEKYPAVTAVLVEARDRISDMTMDTISDVLSTGRPLSVTQRKNIATMLAKKDTYMSRAYAAFQAGRGRKWAETRWANFAKNIGADVDQITNPKVKADVKAVRDAITVITKGLQIPDVNSMQDMTMDQLLNLADRHGIKESQLQFDRTDPDASWLKRDELISELEKVKASYPDGMLEKIAMGDAKDILGLGDKESNYAKQMSALARNPGTLKERQRVPLEIRRLLGEIELAPGAFMATMSNQAALRARAKVVSELINDPEGDIAITREKYLAMSEKEQAKYTQVNSEEWGGLNGMYLRDYAYTRMEEVTGLMYSWRDAAKRMSHDVSPLTGKLVSAGAGTLGALNRWTKLMAVVYNPMSWIGNFGGSFLNMVGSGNFSPTAMSEGMGTAREYVGGTFNTTTTPRLSKVIRYMNLEAADIAELQNVLGNTLEKYFDNPESFKGSVTTLDKHGHGLLGRGHRSIIAGYAIADNWSKIANFYHRYGVLKNMYEAAGITKTEEQILQEAGDDTSYTNISPERVHSIIRTAESAGLSQYAPYFAEVLRTRATNLVLAHKDMQRGSQLRKDGHTQAANIIQTHAAMRLAGQVAVNALLPAVGAFKIASHLVGVGVPAAAAYSLANYMSALGGDDEENEKKRRMLSEMNRVQDLMQVGVNKNGYPIYLPFSQKLDPNGPFTDLVRAFVYAESPEQLYNNLKASSLYIFPQVLKDSYKALTDDKFAESDVTRLWPQLTQTLVDAGISANDADRFFNVADNFIPGVLRAQKTQNTTDGVAADPATTKSLERLSTLGGVRFETLDPRRVLKGYSDKSNDDKATHNGVVNRSLMNTPTLTKKAVLDITEDFFRKEVERQKNDYKNVQSLRAWKFNDEQIGELLSQGGYPKKSIPDLVEGNAVVAIKLKSLIEYADSSGAYQDSRDYEKRTDKAVQVVKMLIEMETELNELGITVDQSQMPKGWDE